MLTRLRGDHRWGVSSHEEAHHASSPLALLCGRSRPRPTNLAGLQNKALQFYPGFPTVTRGALLYREAPPHQLFLDKPAQRGRLSPHYLAFSKDGQSFPGAQELRMETQPSSAEARGAAGSPLRLGLPPQPACTAAASPLQPPQEAPDPSAHPTCSRCPGFSGWDRVLKPLRRALGVLAATGLVSFQAKVVQGGEAGRFLNTSLMFY